MVPSNMSMLWLMLKEMSREISSLLERCWTPPGTSRRNNRCGEARVIWRKRRGSRIRGVGFGEWRDEKPCIFPRGGIAYIAFMQRRGCRPRENGSTAFIRRDVATRRGQPIQESGKRQNTKKK